MFVWIEQSIPFSWPEFPMVVKGIINLNSRDGVVNIFPNFEVNKWCLEVS